MPYSGRDGQRFERAHPLGHVPTVQNELVAARLKRYRSPTRDTESSEHRHLVKSLLVARHDLADSDRDIRWLMAVDGSEHEEEYDTEFPSTRLLFTQVAGVLVDLHRLRQTRHGFADPAAIADAQRGDVFAGFLPSSNLRSLDDEDPVRAFRRELHTLMAETKVNDINLLDVLVGLETLRPESDNDKTIKCPNPQCGRAFQPNEVARDGSPCANSLCDETLWPTDGLRVHEVFDPWGPNGTVGTRVMTVLEQLSLACFGRSIQQDAPRALEELAFIADGPLALFGEPSRLRRTVLTFWQRLSAQIVRSGGRPPLIIGIEKSGEFIEHAHNLEELLEPGHLMLLPVDYIQRFISFRNNTYGMGNYFGRKFIYRTRDDRTIVFTAPPLASEGLLPYRNGDPFQLDDYPTLGATCRLLDYIGTRLHDDAVIPVALAHRWTAYPLRTAGRVLKLHAEQHLATSQPAP